MSVQSHGLAASRLLPMLGIGAVTAIGLALAIGSGSTGPGDLIDVIRGAADDATRDVILRLRLPRTLAAFGTGAYGASRGGLRKLRAAQEAA